MTTYADILSFVKLAARVNAGDTTRDVQIGTTINAAYRKVLGSDFFPFTRVTATQALTAGTQEYALPANFGQMAAEGVRIYLTTDTFGVTNQYLEMVQQPDSDLWDNFTQFYTPQAFVIVAGTTVGLRKIRLLPNFTCTGYTLGYTYYKHLDDIGGTDAVGSPLICDAIAYTALSDDADWTRDEDAGTSQQNYMRKAAVALKQARSELRT